MLYRLLALIKKEILAIKNDKKSFMVVIIPPLVQVIIFSFAATLEVKNIDLVLLNQDGSQKSQELIRNFQGSPYIKSLNFVKSYEEGKEKIDIQDAIGFLIIPSNFAKELQNGSSNIQLILDGRRSNTSQIVEGYINQIILNSFKKEENISKMLQYKIENDTLAFRKIIESNYENELNEENIKSLISKHILFTDLEINTSNIELQNHTSPSELWRNISSIEDVNDENIDSILENLEGLAYEN